MRRCLIVSTFWEDDGFDFNKHHNPFCHRILGGGRSDGSIETLLDVICVKINAIYEIHKIHDLKLSLTVTFGEVF